jgi:hypothetical protein
VIREKDAVLMREGMECCTAPLPSPIAIGQWFRVTAHVNQGEIRILVDDVPLLEYNDPDPLTGPLHAWIGLLGKAEDWFRNLQISAPQLTEDAPKELLPPASDQPLPNGRTIYELTVNQEALDKDWWLSRPEGVNIENGSLDLRGFNLQSQLILDRPLQGNVALEAEMEYATPQTLNFNLALWAADALPRELESRAGGWLAWLPNGRSTSTLQWHGGPHQIVRFLWASKSETLDSSAYHTPIRSQRCTVRLEAIGDRARLFLDERLLLDGERPSDAAGKDLPMYAAIGQIYAPVLLHAVRVYQLDDQAGLSLPKMDPPRRMPVEDVLPPDETMDNDDQLTDLCRLAREDWQSRRFARSEAPVLKEHFVLYATSLDGTVPEFSTWDELVANSERLDQSIDEVTPHPDPPSFKVDGPVALIRLPLAECRVGDETHFVENLAMAVRQNGNWRSAVAVNGNWRLTADDRFDPKKEEHQSFERFYEEIGRASEQRDLEAMLRQVHPQYRAVMPDRNDPEQAFVGDREALNFEGLVAPDAPKISEVKTTIHYVKVLGLIALVVKETELSIDGARQPSVPSVEVFCREQDQWKACLCIAGDWEDLLVDAPHQ